ELPFDATYILADVQKAFMPWGSDSSPRDGDVRAGRYQILQWTEMRNEDRPQTRTFWRKDLDDAVPLRVEYGYSGEHSFPTDVTLHNPWFSYTLHIHTLKWKPL